MPKIADVLAVEVRQKTCCVLTWRAAVLEWVTRLREKRRKLECLLVAESKVSAQACAGEMFLLFIYSQQDFASCLHVAWNTFLGLNAQPCICITQCQ